MDNRQATRGAVALDAGAIVAGLVLVAFLIGWCVISGLLDQRLGLKK